MPDPTGIRQKPYLKELESGPKTTRDMVLSLGRSGGAVAQMMKKLREKGLVKSTRVFSISGNIWQHELIPPNERKS